MIKIQVESIGWAQKIVNEKLFKKHVPFAIITVTQSHFWLSGGEYPPEVVDHIIIDVDDIDEDFVKKYPEAKVGRIFTKKDAKEIRTFVELYKDRVEFFLIHCDAGVSRSRAVAAALEFVYNGNDGEHFKKGVPNATIYKLMLEAYGLSNNYTEQEKEPCWVCGKNWGLESGLWNSHLISNRTWHVECDDDYKELIAIENSLRQ